MPTSVRVRVPAKVNLHLSVGPLHADGYHELITVFHAVDITDELIATEGSGISLTVSGAGTNDVPVGPDNLAWRAAELLAEATGVAADVHLELRKRIPVAGGMAGGSADAAAALVGCARLWDVTADLPQLAARLGADVAFPLLGWTAIGTGRGELLDPVPVNTVLHWAFALADAGISTGAAYGELDRLRDSGAAPEPIGAPDALLAALASGDATAVAANLGNDLEAAACALRPELGKTLAAGRDAGALAALVSGSGPTCAFLCTSAEHAQRIAAALPGRAVTARGPVPGAQVF
jgi:4-diphosphocytidyl-2-C-methyl-D-erythritol kinase